MRASTTFAAIAASAALVLLGASSSVAVDETIAPLSTDQCPASALCIWSATVYSGSFASTKSTTAAASNIAVAKSVWNRSSYAARVYSRAGGAGTSTCYAPGAKIAVTTAASLSFRLLSTKKC